MTPLSPAVSWPRKGYGRVDTAKPKRAASPAQLAALAKALAARRRCPECGTDAGYVLSARLGACNPCAERSPWLASEAA